MEGSKQSLADVRAKDSALQRRLDAEQASLNELGQRIEQLLRREDNLSCIEARARRHDAEVCCAAAACFCAVVLLHVLLTKSSGAALHRHAAAAAKPAAES